MTFFFCHETWYLLHYSFIADFTFCIWFLLYMHFCHLWLIFTLLFTLLNCIKIPNIPFYLKIFLILQVCWFSFSLQIVSLLINVASIRLTFFSHSLRSFYKIFHSFICILLTGLIEYYDSSHSFDSNKIRSLLVLILQNEI